MTRRLVATYLILAAVVLVALEVPLGVINERGQRRDLQQRVERDAVALAALVEDTLQSGARPGDVTLTGIVREYGAATGARVVVVGPGGRALADSDPGGRELGRDFSTRPEIAAALEGRVATGTRRSDTLDTDLVYVAVPVASGGSIHGVVRASVPTSRVDALVRRYWLILAGVGAIVLAGVALVGLWLARWVSRPVTDLRDAARRAGDGDLAVRAATDSGPDEVRDLSDAFNEMVARLEGLIASQERFVADASHQLRSPLTALRLRVENLQHGADPATVEELDGAIGEVDRLSRLIDGLLAIARARAPEGARRPHEIDPLVAGRVEAWSAAAADRDVRLVADAASGRQADLAPGSLEQVLDNLIANALGVSPAGGTVRVGARADDGAVLVEVADEGPGMTDEERGRAFDRFWRGREDGRSGSGLGLAIVRTLVEADGGSVDLTSPPAGGLRARVRLPARRD